MRKQMISWKTITEKVIVSLLVLKIHFRIPLFFENYFILLAPLQSIFFILQSEEFKEYQNEWPLQLIKLLLSPCQTIIQQVSNNIQYYFLIATIITLIHKVSLSYFVWLYFRSKKQDVFIKQCQNNFFLVALCTFLNLYQNYIANYLFQDLWWVSYSILKYQFTILKQESTMPLLFAINLLTVIILLLDSTIFLFISERALTNKIVGLDKINITACRLIQQMCIILSIIISQTEISYVSQILSSILLVQLSAFCYDIFRNISFPLQSQINLLCFAIAANSAFQISYLGRLCFQEKFRFQVLQFIGFFSLILEILLQRSEDLSKNMFRELFSTDKNNFILLRQGLITLLNNQNIGKQKDLIMRILISRDHSQFCTNKKCMYCNHLSTYFPDQSCGITMKIYKDFILNRITSFLLLAQKETQRNIQKKIILAYALFLYDFGNLLKSIKILDRLNNLEQQNQVNSNNLNNILIKDFVLSSSNSCEQKSENLTSKSAHNENQWNESNISLIQLTYLEKISIKFAILNAKSQISSTLLGSSLMANQQSLIQEFAEEFLINEVQIQEFEKKILITIKRRLHFYKEIKNHSVNKDYNLWVELFKLCDMIYSLQRELKNIYKKQPSPRLHSLYCFFLGEIIQNYNKAITFQKNQQYGDINQNKFLKIKNFNLNTQNFQYVILELQDDMRSLKIFQQSQTFFQQYGKGISCSFEELLPSFLIGHHAQYVSQFFETGYCKFYNVFNINFITNPYHLLTTINMCITITNLYKLDNLAFAVFLQETTQDQAFLLIDGKTYNCSFTKNLLLLIGWTQTQIEQLCTLEKLDKVRIANVFPNFERLVKGNKQKEIKINSAVLHFPQPTSTFESLPTDKTILSSPLRTPLLKIKFYSIECDIVIIKRQINNYTYFVLDILKISNQPQQRQSITSSCQQTSKKITSSNQSKENYFVNKEAESPKIGFLNSVNHQTSNQMASIKNPATELYIISINSFQNPQESNPKEEQIESKNIENMYQLVIDQFQYDEITSNQVQIVNDSEMNLISQRNTTRPVFNNSQNQVKNQIANMENTEQKPIINKNKSSKSKQETYPKDQMHKIYELVEKILQLQSKRFQRKLFFLFFLWHITFLSLILLQFIMLTADFQQFMFYLEMITFHAAIMGPHDLFFSMRVTITAYQQMNREGLLPNDHLYQLTEPYYDYIDLGFTELRDSLYEQLSNKYLERFLDEENLTIQYMSYNQTELTQLELSFRDSMLQVLQYQFAQMMTFYHRESTAGKPFQIFLFANYFMFHDVCETISADLQEYTILMHQTIKNKWIMLWSMFITIQLSFFIFLQWYLQTYFTSLEHFNHLIQFVREETINQEISHCQNLSSQISVDQKTIYEYDPLQQIVKHFSKEQKIQKKQFQFNSQNYNQKSSIRILNFVFIFFLMSLFLIYSITTIIISNNFFDKYPDTCEFFTQIQDMKLRSGNLFLYREIFFRWSNFTFLTDDNKLQLYQLVNKAQSAIQNYVSTSNMINVDNYLFSSNFSNILNDINTNNFCSYIDQKFQNLSSRYCSISFEGSIDKGILYTLNYISNSIKTQQQVNNFSKRVEGTYYEQEGSQIVSRIFFVLDQSLRNNLHEIANSLIYIIQALSISYIVLIAIILTSIYLFYLSYLGRLLKVNQRIVYVLPFDELMYNEHLERKLKELANKLREF